VNSLNVTVSFVVVSQTLGAIGDVLEGCEVQSANSY
jgi:hypothetical protein